MGQLSGVARCQGRIPHGETAVVLNAAPWTCLWCSWNNFAAGFAVGGLSGVAWGYICTQVRCAARLPWARVCWMAGAGLVQPFQRQCITCFVWAVNSLLWKASPPLHMLEAGPHLWGRQALRMLLFLGRGDVYIMLWYFLTPAP
jgi:hypothetical protein